MKKTNKNFKHRSWLSTEDVPSSELVPTAFAVTVGAIIALVIIIYLESSR